MSSPISNIIDSFKNMLSLGPKSVFGIDIGLSAVKVAQIDISGSEEEPSYKLVKYASVALPEGAIIEDEIQKQEEIVEAIKEAVSTAGIKEKFACLGLTGPNTVVKHLQLPGGDEEEIEDQVLWEAEQYLPFDIENSSISFHNVGENEGGGLDVVVAAARNDIIQSFIELVEGAGFKVKIADLGMISVINAFEYIEADKFEEETDSYLVLDLGAQKTAFMIYKNGTVIFTKEINVGGVMITEEIQRQMGVNYIEAEDLKVTGDESGNLPEEILAIVDDVIEAFFSEIKKTMDFYVSSTSDESLASCFITGGSIQIPGILEGLEALLGVEVSVINPFEKMDYDSKKISEEEINDIAYRGVSVIGLAMRSL
ncbi:type IV pilus assembly protein PilM [Bacteriovoracaceae bacterium]|nr:type IV pilus assembly protein PilM [Bacteriovoracaceae bacterium]